MQAFGEFGKFSGNLTSDVGLISPIVKVARSKEPINGLTSHFFSQNPHTEHKTRSIRRRIPAAVSLQLEKQILIAEPIHQKIIGAVCANNIGDTDGQIFINKVLNLRGKFFGILHEIFLLTFGKNLWRKGIMEMESISIRVGVDH